MTSSVKESTSGTLPTQPIVESTESATLTSSQPTTTLYMDMEPLHHIADGKTIRVPKNPNFTRKDVVDAFSSAFQLIGGVPRLALWANENESDFFKLYARLLPSQSSSALGEANTLKIEMAIKPGPLDQG